MSGRWRVAAMIEGECDASVSQDLAWRPSR